MSIGICDLKTIMVTNTTSTNTVNSSVLASGLPGTSSTAAPVILRGGEPLTIPEMRVAMVAANRRLRPLPSSDAGRSSRQPAKSVEAGTLDTVRMTDAAELVAIDVFNTAQAIGRGKWACPARSPATMGGVPGGLGALVVADVVDVVEFEMNGPDPLGLGPAHAPQSPSRPPAQADRQR